MNMGHAMQRFETARFPMNTLIEAHGGHTPAFGKRIHGDSDREPVCHPSLARTMGSGMGMQDMAGCPVLYLIAKTTLEAIHGY